MLILYNVDWHVTFIQRGLACCFSIMWIAMLLFYNVNWHVALVKCGLAC